MVEIYTKWLISATFQSQPEKFMGQNAFWLPIAGTTHECPFTDEDLEAFNAAAQWTITNNRCIDRFINGYRVVSNNRETATGRRRCDLQIIKNGIGNYVTVLECPANKRSVLFEISSPTT